nr:hypothetical protein CFP56_76097 [Quercus suber]
MEDGGTGPPNVLIPSRLSFSLHFALPSAIVTSRLALRPFRSLPEAFSRNSEHLARGKGSHYLKKSDVGHIIPPVEIRVSRLQGYAGFPPLFKLRIRRAGFSPFFPDSRF